MKGSLMPYIEGCFSFNDLDTNNYKTKLTEDIRYSNILKITIKAEEKVQKFYLDGAKECESLMADISRVLKKIAKKRDKRKIELESPYNRSMGN